MKKSLSAALAIALLCNAGAAPENIAPILEPILESSGLPSIAAAVTNGDETLALGAIGLRKLGESSEVNATDRYHLGSCTKSMTATLAAILIEEGRIGWAAQNEGMSPKKQRLQYITSLLTTGAEYPAGTKTEYSNQGYAVAGVMLEIVGKKPWESLVREKIFKPLRMKSAGFRAPDGKNAWGHDDGKPTLTDNPDAIGPAGTAHASLGDWAKFIRFHLARKTGTLLREKSSFDKLHATLPNSGQHTIGGWLQGKNEFVMNGSNTHWRARFIAYPERDIAILTATNSAQDGSRETLKKIEETLLTKFAP